MLLAIDVGNTETVVGMFAGGEETPAQLSLPGENAGPGEAERTAVGASVQVGEDGATEALKESELPVGLVHHWRISTMRDHTPDEHALAFTQLLAMDGVDPVRSVGGIAVSSSVPPVTGALRRMAERWFPGADLVVLEPGLRSGMPIMYEDPREVGPDRIANAIAAYDLYGGPCIVVDLGTATTFDAVSEAGEYLGGAIVPGVAISMDALFAHAAALRTVELVSPKSVIGRSTAESIRSGILYGFAGQVDSMCRLFREELGEATVVATGGLCDMVVPFCTSVEHVDPWLTLHGLRLVYERARRGR